MPDKKRFVGMPLERHDTAAWANFENSKAHSDGTIPSDIDMEDAKDWVDSNQK